MGGSHDDAGRGPYVAAPIGPAQVLVPGMRGEQFIGTTLLKDLGTLLSLAVPSWNGLIRTDPLPINK